MLWTEGVDFLSVAISFGPAQPIPFMLLRIAVRSSNNGSGVGIDGRRATHIFSPPLPAMPVLCFRYWPGAAQTSHKTPRTPHNIAEISRDQTFRTNRSDDFSRPFQVPPAPRLLSD